MRSLIPLALLLSSSAFAQTTLPETERSEILWWYGNNGEEPLGSSFQTEMQNRGGSVTFADSGWATLTFEDYRVVVLGRPLHPFDADQIADLQAFLDDQNGILVVAGDDAGSAGTIHIDTVNDLLDALTVPPVDSVGANAPIAMELVNTSINATDTHTACANVPVTANSPFWTTLSGVSNGVETMGNIETGAGASILSAATFNINNVVVQARLAARQGRVLLTSDFQLFSSNTCGQAGRLALYENLWEYWCDRDEDGAISAECGLFDCNDFDGLGVNTYTYLDADGDGYGSQQGDCSADAVNSSGDCEDDDPTIHPGADEVCDEIDNDCDLDIDEDDDDLVDGTFYYPDTDRDGYGRPSDNPRLECVSPGDTWADNGDDCADGDDEINPDATEVCGNDEDDDCNGEVDESCNEPEPTNPPAPTGGTGSGGGGCRVAPLGAGWAALGLLGLVGRRRR